MLLGNFLSVVMKDELNGDYGSCVNRVNDFILCEKNIYPTDILESVKMPCILDMSVWMDGSFFLMICSKVDNKLITRANGNE